MALALNNSIYDLFTSLAPGEVDAEGGG